VDARTLRKAIKTAWQRRASKKRSISTRIVGQSFDREVLAELSMDSAMPQLALFTIPAVLLKKGATADHPIS
jgi:hypothetical protein